MNTFVEFRFPAGRYHATPWGRHVNEGAIEWPPSPWRICRALLAVGFNRVWFTQPPPEALSLLGKVTSVLPTYHLPPAGTAHTRHYMPPFKGNTSRVLDAFAIVDPDDPLVVEFPVELDAREIGVLDALLERMTYLGRAESWVEARRTSKIPEGRLERCEPEVSDFGQVERTDLLAPEPGAAFAAWRAQAVEAARRARLDELAASTKKKEPRKVGPPTLSDKDRRAIEGRFPADIVEALTADTGDLRKEGWSQPPGSRWVAWWLRQDALSSVRRSSKQARRGPEADTALFAVRAATRQSRILPPLTDAYVRAEPIHRALVKHSDANDGKGPSAVLTGGREGHRHATIIPISLSGTNKRRRIEIDHVLIHATGGFDARALDALDSLDAIWSKAGTFRLSRLFLGRRQDLALRETASSRVWESRTPFIPPLHLKHQGSGSLAGQIVGGLILRGLRAPERIELMMGDRLAPIEEFWQAWKGRVPDLTKRWREFKRMGRKRRGLIPGQPAVGLRLTFAEDVPGPLTLGYGAHFGLGHFVPV